MLAQDKRIMIAALLVCVLGAVEATAAGTREEKNRPVTKVINLLKDMQDQMEKEGREDEEVYEKVACWCEMNDKEKSLTIVEAEARITDLTSTIEEKTASSARLNTEIKNLEAEIAKNQGALDKATAIREKQLSEFNAEEKDLLQSVGALKSAITVLSKHHSPNDEAMLEISAMIDMQFKKHKALLEEIITPAQRRAVSLFVQAPGDYFDEQPAFKQSYAPQSGEIFGILKQMKETFETNLSASQKEEMQNQAAYEDLKAAKEEEIKAGQAQLDTKTQELADTDQHLSQAKLDLEDTRNSLTVDEKFLINLKQTCQQTDAEWDERQKMRQEEIQAVSEALAILSADDAHDTFTKTFNFVQVKPAASLLQEVNREKASKLLFDTAKEVGNPALAAVAQKVRLDAFEKVKMAIDDMVTQLIKEKEDEIKHKDFCTAGFNDNGKAQELKARDIDDLDAEIAQLTSTIAELTKSVGVLQSEIAEMQLQLKRAGEDREVENKDFQATVSDQRETQKLLTSALNVLKAVYAKKFLQVGASKRLTQPGPPPPPGFGEYKKAGGAGGVLGMLEQIIADAKTLEMEAIKAESDAQKAYEVFLKDTNASIEKKNRDITNKSEEKSTAEGHKTSAEEARDAALNEQQQNKNEEATAE